MGDLPETPVKWEEPLYKCHHCKDTGFRLRESMTRFNYEAMYSWACKECDAGRAVNLRQSLDRAERERPKKQEKPRNYAMPKI